MAITDFFRRKRTVQASMHEPLKGKDWSQSIIVDKAQDRLLEYFSREQVPGDVKSTLASALHGDLHYQHLLFCAMFDTWPKLQKAVATLARKVSVAPWKVHPYAPRGEDPSDKDQAIANDMERILWGMRPRPHWNENGVEGTIKELVRAYYMGHGVSEIHWMRDPITKEWVPRCTKPISARFFGYEPGNHNQEVDRLKFDCNGSRGMRMLEDFEDHRFLIAVNRGHSGHASTAAPLRALAQYWLAAVYGLKWLLEFSQIYGIPWRHAEVADPKDRGVVDAALASIGARGFIVTEPGTKINVMDAPSTSGSNLPQKILVDLADQQCDQFILGQTLTGGTDKSGSRALGEVHERTEESVVEGLADFVGEVFSYQLIPSIYALNWKQPTEGLPTFWAKTEPQKDIKATAEVIALAQKMGVPISLQYVQEELGIPAPEDGTPILPGLQAHGVQGDPGTGPVVPPHETKPADQDNSEEEEAKGKAAKVAAADASKEKPLDVEDLAEAVLEGLTGTAAEWLGPVRPFFERLAALAMSKHVTDEDFNEALKKAQAELPELFDLLDSQALQDAFENAIGTAMIAGSVTPSR